MELPTTVVLACPKCGKQYRVDAKLLGRNKRVCCRVCSTTFIVSAEAAPSHVVDEDRIVAWLQQSPAEE
jgi:predicted Zn finger-like uncharacterized protein